MSSKPIFVATHPRACSTAFERVFMTCRDTLSCVHEPFGDAWYFGPERLSSRYTSEDQAKNKREDNGFSNYAYGDVFEAMEAQETKEGKRLFIKDMAQYWFPMAGEKAHIALSLVENRRGVGTTNGVAAANGIQETQNPTVIPEELLRKFHFTFLIRHPRSSIPSYYRCTIPPLDSMTGFDYFDPREAGYKELRALFEFLAKAGHIGPRIAGNTNGSSDNHSSHLLNGEKASNDQAEICVVDADDLLDNPYGVIEAYCKSVGLEYSPKMLKWDDEETQVHAKETFERWNGFHEDALNSTELKPRTHKKTPKSDEELVSEWTQKYGKKEAMMMMQTVEENVADYEYLKQFALKV